MWSTFLRPRSAGGPPVHGLPAGCTTRRALPGDAEHVASRLRGDDRLEMEALEGRPALDVLRGWMSGGSHVLLIRGDAAAIFGIIPSSGVPAEFRAATPWAAMVSTLAHDDLVDTLWLARQRLDAWQRRWAMLQTVCDARNRFRGRCLGWLGFERRGRLERFGAAGLPFDLHVRVGAVAGGLQ